jgi:glycosyltransferase involved in cell wall biosynthesis
MRVAVDAWNLADDRRGMGRYVRRILDDWQSEAGLEVTLLTRTGREARGTYDVVWYPWNAIRFELRGARRVVTFYDAFAFTHAHPQWVARTREQGPIRRAMRRADARATISRWSADELARVFGVSPSLFTVIPPVPDPFWQPVSSPRRAPYFLVVTGPEERKNLRTLLAAYERAFPQREVELVVAGNAPEATIRPSDEELRALYAGASAVAVPSSAEGYGLMTVEAMACGAPVIASDASALPEAADGAALLVPPFDVDAWAKALREVGEDATLRAALRERSLARAARIDRSAPARATLALLRRSLEAAR